MNKTAKRTAPNVTLAGRKPAASSARGRVDGVVIAKLASAPRNGRARVIPSGAPASGAIAARLAASLKPSDVGADVAVVFEAGDPQRPIVLGRVQRFPGSASVETGAPIDVPVTARLDGESVILEAAKEIVLRCGEATITLTRAGKILIQGAYVSSRSSGVNRIRGGAVQIN